MNGNPARHLVLFGLLSCFACGSPEDDECVSELLEDIATDTVLAGRCYRVEYLVVVDARLTVRPGVRISFAKKAGMQIGPQGVLEAVGTAQEPIRLIGEQPSRGYWRGLTFANSESKDNRIEHVTIEHGGSEAYAGAEPANLSVRSSGFASRLAVRSCTLRESAGYGFHLDDEVELLAFSGNTCTANASGAGSVGAHSARFIEAGNTLTGNDVDVVYIAGNAVEQDLTWQAIGVPFLHGDVVTVVSAKLTLAPGVQVVFAKDTGLKIDDQGTLHAVGTASAPIQLRGELKAPGAWQGIQIANSNHDNRLEQLTIQHGGGYEWAFGKRANIGLTSSGFPVRATIRGCTISDSAGWGVWTCALGTVNPDLETANTFSGNALGNSGKEP